MRIVRSTKFDASVLSQEDNFNLLLSAPAGAEDMILAEAVIRAYAPVRAQRTRKEYSTVLAQEYLAR
jgi:hypothetical protein